MSQDTTTSSPQVQDSTLPSDELTTSTPVQENPRSFNIMVKGDNSVNYSFTGEWPVYHALGVLATAFLDLAGNNFISSSQHNANQKIDYIINGLQSLINDNEAIKQLISNQNSTSSAENVNLSQLQTLADGLDSFVKNIKGMSKGG